ncbi:MAG TPA: chemotaxis protein CheA [Gemmatimonadaceae bacterium]|nr:chemotaxis protein CheA [Gemmatimonadaceae bacterium]
MDLSQYAQLFREESEEHVAAINAALLALEASGDPLAVQELFRSMHTVKGMSAAMGFTRVAELAHETESLLDALRGGRVALTESVVETLFAAADLLAEAIAGAVAGEDDRVEVAPVVARLREHAGEPPDGGAPSDAGAVAPTARTTPTGSGPGLGQLVRVTQTADSPLRGVRALLVLQRVEAMGQVTDVDPPREQLPAERYGGTFQFRLHTDASPTAIAEQVRGAGDVAAVVVDGVAMGGDDAAAPVPVAPATAAAPEPALSVQAPAAPRTIRIDPRRLDALLNLVGELVIARGRLHELTRALHDGALDETAAEIDRHVRQLQDEILAARLVPVWQLFERFPRMVRDAARSVGKEVRFEVQGREIELDRSLLDEIVDPIVHLLRNAVDHGLEPPAERRAAGKPPAGRLVLSASRDRDTVLVRVRDDGRGIDRAKVLRRAIAEGLVDPATQTLGDEQVLRLIARAGFSTAERVTDLSGRGVGVDAVQTRLQSLGGSVELETATGRGTTVTLRLPMTLAIVRAVIARVGEETYALPAGHVSATGELAAAMLTTVRGEPVMVVGEEVLPAVDLRAMIGRPAADPARGEYVVLDGGDRRIGMLVDELTGQQEIVVKRFDAARGALPIFSGATILGNGRPALIVDVGRLL